MTTTTTLEDIVAITQSVGADSEPWQSIASHSTDDQAWFWTPEWQAGEDAASLEIQQGRLSKKLFSAEEIRQHLDTL
jgi:hypothetical protein